MSVPSPSILDGVGAIFDRWLAVPPQGKPPYYQHRSADRALSGSPRAIHNPLLLITEALDQIERNWLASRSIYGKLASKKNWRFERQLDIAEENDSPEVRLERAIAKAHDDGWANQVPTASGLTGPRRDRHRHIDLVCRNAPAVYTFYELKVPRPTNKPLYATMELLVRGLLYLFSRRHLSALGYDPSTRELLRAETVHLRVLAPLAFYTGIDLSWLAVALTAGLTQYLRSVPDLTLTMDLAFEAFPFAITHTDESVRIREALARLVPVYG